MKDQHWAGVYWNKFEAEARRKKGTEKRRQYPGRRQMRVPRGRGY